MTKESRQSLERLRGAADITNALAVQMSHFTAVHFNGCGRCARSCSALNHGSTCAEDIKIN